MARAHRPLHAGLYHVATGSTRPDPFFRDDIDRGCVPRRARRCAPARATPSVSGSASSRRTTTSSSTWTKARSRRVMQRLNWHYARAVNRRHHRLGHVVGRRYLSVPIVDDAHLLTGYRYVAWNLVRAGVVKRPQDSRWSSYATTVGLRRDYSFVDATRVVGMLRTTVRDRDPAAPRLRRSAYRRVRSRTLASRPLRDGRLEQLRRDERARAGAEARTGPRARADVEQPLDRRRVPGAARERPPQEVLVERERAAVRVAVAQVDVLPLEVVRPERRRASRSTTRGSGSASRAAPGSGRRTARAGRRSTSRPRRRARRPRRP